MKKKISLKVIQKIELKALLWKQFKIGVLPDYVQEYINEKSHDGMGSIFRVYYKELPKSINDWIIVTDNGWYYKVGATYMVWKGEDIAMAIWSDKYLKVVLNDLFNEKEPKRDPDYQS